MKRLRILEISLRADRSGGPRHLLSLLRLFPKDLDIIVCAPPNEDMSDDLRRHALALIPCPRRRFTLPTFYRLWRAIRHYDVDIIHSHGRGAGLYSRLLGAITGKPVVHTFHAVHVADGFVGRVKDLMDRSLRNLAEAYILVSPDELNAAKARAWLPARAFAEVIQNGVDIPPESLRRVPTNTPIIGNIVRKDPVKGWDLMSRYLTNLLAKMPFRLEIAGLKTEDFRLPPSLLPVAGNMGILVDTNDLFRQIDLYVSTSRNEGLPLAVLEAMASGVPCLLSKVPGHIGLIEAGAAEGYELQNEAEFALKITNLLADPEARNRLGDHGRAHVTKHHSAPEMARLTADLYRRVYLRSQPDAN